MSKKVSFPVMSLAFTGILYVLGLLVITLRPFLVIALTATPATALLVSGLLEFAATFILIWALTSLALHPDIEDSNIKLVFAAFTVFILIAVFTAAFGLNIKLWH